MIKLNKKKKQQIYLKPSLNEKSSSLKKFLKKFFSFG